MKERRGRALGLLGCTAARASSRLPGPDGGNDATQAAAAVSWALFEDPEGPRLRLDANEWLYDRRAPTGPAWAPSANPSEGWEGVSPRKQRSSVLARTPPGSKSCTRPLLWRGASRSPSALRPYSLASASRACPQA